MKRKLDSPDSISSKFAKTEETSKIKLEPLVHLSPWYSSGKDKEEYQMLWMVLPIELWKFHILKNLDLETKQSLRLVCRLFLQLVNWNLHIPVHLVTQFMEFTKAHPWWPTQIKSIFSNAFHDFMLPLETLQQLTHLETLKLTSCHNFNDYSIKFLPTSLKCLKLTNCEKVSDEGMQNLPTSLTHLKVTHRIGNKGLSYLSHYTNLTTLNLASCLTLTDAALSHLPSHLTDLDLFYCRITGSGFQYLPTTLTKFRANSFRGEHMKHLHNLANLQHLNMGLFARPIRSEDLQYIPPNLTRLDLPSTFHEEGFQNLPSSLKELTGVYRIQATGIQYFPVTLQNLELFSCPSVTSEHLAAFTSLHKLHLFSCSTLTGASFQYLASTITELVFSECGTVIDQHLPHLPRGLHKLRLSASQLTDAGLGGLPDTLRKLSLQGCSLLTDASFGLMPTRLTRLEVSGYTVRGCGVRDLPSSVTRLYVGESLMDSGWMTYLPRTLRRLHLEKIGGKVEGLPVTLRELELSYCESVDVVQLESLVNLKRLTLHRCDLKENQYEQYKNHPSLFITVNF